MVLKYFQDKQIQAQRAEKSEEQRMKKIASIIAKEIKNFWGDVHKVIQKKSKFKHLAYFTAYFSWLSLKTRLYWRRKRD
jgi:hypothetical protein